MLNAAVGIIILDLISHVNFVSSVMRLPRQLKYPTFSSYFRFITICIGDGHRYIKGDNIKLDIKKVYNLVDWIQVACMGEKRNAYSVLMGKPEGMRPPTWQTEAQVRG